MKRYSDVSAIQRIFSMANSWKNVRKDLQDHLFVMFEHLIKIYYYHNYWQYVPGWITSVRKGFEHLSKLSNTNKYPSEEQLFQFIWNEWLDGEINNLQDSIVTDLNEYYDEVPPIENIDYDGVRDFCILYIRYLSKIISIKGNITCKEIQDFV